MRSIKAHFFKQKLQNCFSLHGDGLAYICNDAFSSFTPMFFGKP